MNAVAQTGHAVAPMSLRMSLRDGGIGWLTLSFSAGGPGGCGCQLDDLLGFGEVEGGEDVALRFGQFGALAVGAGRAGEGADVQLVEVFADVVPGRAGAGLGDTHEQ